MSSTTVRAQLQTFLEAGNITGLNKIYKAEPTWASGEDWDLDANAGWGAIGWPEITDESEQRETLGAPSGGKSVTYKVGIVLLYQWLIPASSEPDDYIGPLDGLIEAVKARLRSDPKAGTRPGVDGVIFQQSQEPGDLKVTRDRPKRAKGGGKIVAWNLLETTVTEMITA